MSIDVAVKRNLVGVRGRQEDIFDKLMGTSRVICVQRDDHYTSFCSWGFGSSVTRYVDQQLIRSRELIRGRLFFFLKRKCCSQRTVLDCFRWPQSVVNVFEAKRSRESFIFERLAFDTLKCLQNCWRAQQRQQPFFSMFIVHIYSIIKTINARLKIIEAFGFLTTQ
jgi:hypothetical protein